MGAGETFEGDILSQAKTAAPQLSGGRCNFTFPPLLLGATLKSKTPRLCDDCAKKAAHDPANKVYFTPAADHKVSEYVAPEYRVLTEDMARLVNAIFILSRIYYGVEYDLLYNQGWTANNISQQETYQIEDTKLTDPALEQNQLRLRGRNPEHLGVGRSRENPEWIGNGGLELNRLITETEYYHLPIGAMGVFGWPSVLRNKQLPWIKKIENVQKDGDNYTFVVTMSKDCSYARAPDDLAFGDVQDYSITFYYYRNTPESWPYIQPSPEMYWTRGAVEILPGDLVEGKWIAPKRILFPGLIDTDGLTVCSCVVTVGGQQIVVDWDDIAVETTQSEGGWITVFDFSNFFEFEKISLTYFHEALPSDTVWFRTRSSCANSRKDWSGSYTHDGTCFCAARIGADGLERPEITAYFAQYMDECWLPNCPFFTLEPAGSCVTGDDLNRLWTAVDLVVEQGLPGCSSYRNFCINMMNNPSLHLMAGFYNRAVATGIGHATKYMMHDAACGQYETFGAGRQRLRKGAFWARDKVDEWDDYEFDMADMAGAMEGLFPAEVIGYKTKLTPAGGNYDNDNDPIKTMRNYPFRNIGNVHLYDYDTGAHGYCRTQAQKAGMESVIVGYREEELLTEDQREEIEEIRGLF